MELERTGKDNFFLCLAFGERIDTSSLRNLGHSGRAVKWTVENMHLEHKLV